MFAEDAWTREAVAAASRRFQVCPFDFSLDLSLWADLIICDYNYAFDPKAYLRRFFLEQTGDYAFLVDEAHNLVDRSREMFSAELRKQPILDLRRAVKAVLPAVYRSLGKVNTWMLEARKRAEAAGAPTAERNAPEELYPHLRDFMAAAEKWLEKNLKSAFREELLERYFEAGGFLRVAEQFDESYAACYEALSNDLRVKLFCIDPSRQIGDALNRCRSAVFFSATLTPLDYFQTMLASESAEALIAAIAVSGRKPGRVRRRPAVDLLPPPRPHQNRGGSHPAPHGAAAPGQLPSFFPVLPVHAHGAGNVSWRPLRTSRSSCRSRA